MVTSQTNAYAFSIYTTALGLWSKQFTYKPKQEQRMLQLTQYYLFCHSYYYTRESDVRLYVEALERNAQVVCLSWKDAGEILAMLWWQ